MNNRKSFIIGIKSFKLSSREKKFLKKYKPWGVILFSRNIKSIKQSHKLVSEIKKIFNDRKYPILIDQEGGRVNRLKDIVDLSYFTSEMFGNLYKKNKMLFNLNLRIFVDMTSFLLNQIGININTVPVLDLKYDKTNQVIGNRSFSKKPKVVNQIGNIFIKHFQKNYIATVIKHIPGHGLATKDSHIDTPIVKRKLNYLLKNDFSVFKNKKSFFAMTAHIIYKDIDKHNTATHSKKVIDLIRSKIKFQNLLISDDISMKSLKFSIEENTVKAFSAGCNLVLHCNAKHKEMIKVAKNSPNVNKFIVKKTSQFYKILS